MPSAPTVPAVSGSVVPPSVRAAGREHRPEIQGLRAVAVLLVVGYHVFADRVSGGVDVFLFLSAFLLTGSFVRRLEQGRPLELVSYWMRTFRRLLPLSALTILAVLVLLVRYYPESEWTVVREQAWASLLYLQNWALADAAVDYYAADRSAASPLQHFWSLSVQGQVFLLWPLLLALAGALHRWTGAPVRKVLLAVFGGVFVLSLAWSVWSTADVQEFAYFDTGARLWEFALGSLLALAPRTLPLPAWLRAVVGWTGLGALLLCGALLDVQGRFPGWVALWPLAAAAAVLTSGGPGDRWGVGRALAWRPLQWLGGVSYALYLVHWPVLITVLVVRESPRADLLTGTLVVLGSVALASLLTRLVDRPLGSFVRGAQDRGRSLLVLTVCLALVAVPLRVWDRADAREMARLEEQRLVDNPGAASLLPDYSAEVNPEAELLPTTAVLFGEPATLGEGCDTAWTDRFSVRSGCQLVRDGGPRAPLVVAVGNSHVEQWVPALEEMAEERDWTLVALVRPGCFFSDGHPNWQDECRSWYESGRSLLEEIAPDTLFMQSTYDLDQRDDENMLAGFRDEVLYWTDRGSTVVGIRDNPRWEDDMAECALEHGVDSATCSHGAARALSSHGNPAAHEMAGMARYGNLDMTDVVCPEGVCRPVVGNVWVYRDDNHLTQQYTRSAAVQFAQRWDAALDGAGK